jgi:CheY-like chemotaxis protein
MNGPARHRLILRAELTSKGETVVTRTRELSTAEVIVAVPAPPAIGEPVEVRLSFPGLLEPFHVSGVVVEQHPHDGPGELPAVTISIRDGAPGYKDKLAWLLKPHPSPNATKLDYRVLIVEDNGMIRDMFAYGVHKYFKAQGNVNVDVAPDGSAAWDLLRSSNYDLAIVDYYMPVVNGGQLIARIRGDERLERLPIVAISVGGEDARRASIDAGADLFLDKPIILRELFATLDRLALHKEQATS